jgi:hypothetical protein
VDGGHSFSATAATASTRSWKAFKLSNAR